MPRGKRKARAARLQKARQTRQKRAQAEVRVVKSVAHGHGPEELTSGPDARSLVASALPRERKSRLMVLAGLLSVALLAVMAIGVRFLMEPDQSDAMAPLSALDTLSVGIGPRFLFSINGVSRPLGVAVSHDGNRIYVTESDGQRETKVFDREGHQVGTLNPPDSAPVSRTPVYVAVNKEGKVYVSDRIASTIHLYSPSGEYLGHFNPPEGENGWAPLALRFDVQGDLLVTDVSPARHDVLVFGPEGTLIRQFGQKGSGRGELSFPNGVVRESSGRIVVADSNNGRIGVYDSEGNLLWYFGEGNGAISFGLPRGVAVDAQNRIYVVDTTENNVDIFQLGEREAQFVSSMGSGGIGDGQFLFPNGIAVDDSGRIYVTDRENNRVQVWTY